jgi:hypothetical protein
MSWEMSLEGPGRKKQSTWEVNTMSKRKAPVIVAEENFWSNLKMETLREISEFCDSVPLGDAALITLENAPGHWELTLAKPGEGLFPLSRELNKLLGLKGDSFPGGSEERMNEILEACAHGNPVKLARSLAEIRVRLNKTLH